MRVLVLAFSAALAAFPAAADTGISAEIGASGISATRDRLAALPAPTDAERYALGGLHFLGAIEATLQVRWRVSFSQQFEMMPVLRLPVPGNPAPEPFRAEVIAEILTVIETGMESASSTLVAIPAGSDFGLPLRLADLWFDINANGQRDPGEDLLDVTEHLLFTGTGFHRELGEQIEIRFDVADSRWLAAYSNLLLGLSQVVLAYDPEAAVRELLQAKAALAALNGDERMANAVDYMVGDFVDTAAVLLKTARNQPDPDRGARALAAFEAVIAHNREFWQLIAAETDNDAEWIPNDDQTSALGLTFPKGTATAWLAVLDDAEALLKGELLLPYWRLSEGQGLNLRKMFLEPRPADVVDWTVGITALHYAERGPRIGAEALWQFDRLMQGRGLMFAAILN